MRRVSAFGLNPPYIIALRSRRLLRRFEPPVEFCAEGREHRDHDDEPEIDTTYGARSFFTGGS
jgi:hypothetical protein